MWGQQQQQDREWSGRDVTGDQQGEREQTTMTPRQLITALSKFVIHNGKHRQEMSVSQKKNYVQSIQWGQQMTGRMK